MGARWTAECTTATRKTACAHVWLGRTRTKNAHTFLSGDKVPAPIKDPPYVPPAVLPKTDNMRLKELKQMLIEGKGQAVVQKVLDIALEDGHPGQMAALKLCMERALPVSLFEKTAAQRAAVTINITGIGGPDAPAPQAEIIDVEMKNG